ncbi:DUF3549 family protein [Alteromonas pelagimontana]|uniref:DUF3549 family protein n=1 Tax=Alteromonas pelagimontana TaxID=1858656 RepID=A0A6M4MI21_9ALTE|nr:DUF3549 family protein [Alteromonas pelagimontana]QJR81766.1 DUF3549 family protein [Alteromonas pelagimontana]
MSASSIHSISEFLLHAGTNFRIFDLGRGIFPLDSQTFLDIENAQVPAPRPRQQYGWFGIVFWNGQQANQHYIWFIKLPLDEQGLIIAASRNHFLQIIIEAVGESLTSDNQQTLPDNPYSFVPGHLTMAQFNAHTRLHLRLPSHPAIEQVTQYISDPAAHDWKNLPVQGIADFAVRLSEDHEAHLVAGNLSACASDFQIALMQAAESVLINEAVEVEFYAHLAKGLTPANPKRPDLAALRGLSSLTPSQKLRDVLYNLLSETTLSDVDTLSVVAARHYNQFDEQLLQLFFERAAELDDNQGHQGLLFKGFFSDLVQIPQLRGKVLSLLRSPTRSDLLAKAIGGLFSHTQQEQTL